jgi:hypothetical protein
MMLTPSGAAGRPGAILVAEHTTFTHGDVTTTFFRRDGKFLARTDGPDGQLHDYVEAYTFSVAPLQQYLIAFPGGRSQALGSAWDSRPQAAGGQRWFHLHPEQRLATGSAQAPIALQAYPAPPFVPMPEDWCLQPTCLGMCRDPSDQDTDVPENVPRLDAPRLYRAAAGGRPAGKPGSAAAQAASAGDSGGTDGW